MIAKERYEACIIEGKEPYVSIAKHVLNEVETAQRAHSGNVLLSLSKMRKSLEGNGYVPERSQLVPLVTGYVLNRIGVELIGRTTSRGVKYHFAADDLRLEELKKILNKK